MLLTALLAIDLPTDPTVELPHVELETGLTLHALRHSLCRQPLIRLFLLVMRVNPNEILKVSGPEPVLLKYRGSSSFLHSPFSSQHS